MKRYNLYCLGDQGCKHSALFKEDDTGEWCEIEDMEKLEQKNKKLEQWVNDLQSQMYVNCVYCGHRYGPRDKTPISMADILRKHIEKCPEHPLYQCRQKNEILESALVKIDDMIETTKTMHEIIDKALEE